MKKIFSLIILILISFSLLEAEVLAETTTYNVSELGLNITIPTEYRVITRDSSIDDPVFKFFKAEKFEVMKAFEKNYIYLNAISKDYKEEIVITMIPNGMSDFNLINDATIERVFTRKLNGYRGYGIRSSGYSFYKHNQAKFIKGYLFDKEKSVNCLQYYTTYDNQGINITLRSYRGEIEQTQEEIMKNIVDSIEFNQEENPANSKYTDSETGVTFVVPENWNAKEIFMEATDLDIALHPAKSDSPMIFYASWDVWENLSWQYKTKYSREDFSNYALEEADFAEIHGISEDKISTVKYNGVEYFKCEVPVSLQQNDHNLKGNIIQLIHSEYGWGYAFMFGASSADKHFSDFEKMMESVEFPKISNALSEGLLDSTLIKVEETLGAIVTAGLIFAIIIVLIVLNLKNQKKADMNKKALCKECGQEIPLDSAFCHICGAKVESGVDKS